MIQRWAILGVLGVLAVHAAPALGQQSVVDSKHNLSVLGTGEIRAAQEQEVCIFCHTPHRSAPVKALWNRQEPALPYRVYTSRAMDAEPGQPTGASKKCLSCHDGSIALGSVLSRDQVITMAGGIITIPAGSPANLGTDLSDDHPISFHFDAALAGRDDRLVNPLGLPPQIQLDAGELQCTACHDAHDNSFGNFLVMENLNSQLCLSCHRIGDTNVTAHEDCRACHRTHSAPSGPFLLVEATVTETCVRCHDGSVHGAANILADLQKLSTHDSGPHIGFDQDIGQTTCTDCHEPHSMMSGPSPSAPSSPASFGQLLGVSSSGSAVESATFEYEVCFRCHGDESAAVLGPVVNRQIVNTSVRQQFDPAGPSYHPVVAPGRGMDVPSLRPGWTIGSQMLCSDCHGSDTSRKGDGLGPKGIHGSNYPSLLLSRYDTLDGTPESPAAYALCYQCHKREGSGGILSDQSFPHRLHVVDARTPCSVCHDAHGVGSAQGNRINNSHLINFDTSVVFPSPLSGRLEFEDRGRFSGSCTLSCHGVPHDDLDYR